MKRSLFIFILSISLLLSATPAFAKLIQYVSDELTIPMRSGTTNGHKILKFLKSGDELEIIESTDDEKYSLVVPVDDNGKTGWVETRLLMEKKSARAQLQWYNEKYRSLKDEQQASKKQLAASQAENSELQNVQSQLKNKMKSLQSTLSKLRKNASDPIRIADENDQLKQQLADTQSKMEELTKENIILGDENIKSWFLIGGAVSIGSLILGVVLTRIRWKKNDRWA